MIPPPATTARQPRAPAGSRSSPLPASLQRQAWLATVFLFCPWVATLVLAYPIFRAHPLVLLALLPGAGVALALQYQLWTYLGANHRQGMAAPLFPDLGTANWITLLRGVAIVALAGFLPLALLPGQALPPALSWAPGLLYLGVSLADLADGFVARRQRRQTELGQQLDIATDGAGLLVALLVAVSLQRLPACTLLVGLAYYLFLGGIRWRRQRHLPLIALQSRPYARIIAGIQMGLVAMALLPIFHPICTTIAALLVMTPLLAGFARDYLVVSCRINIDSNQHTVVDHWSGLVLGRYLPLGLRLAILVSALLALATNVAPPLPAWWLAAQTLCCLLAVLGCLARSSALLLCLLLGSHWTPFGTALPSLILFTLATTLLLTGTGPLSLWAPEEDILYRRNRDQSLATGGQP